MWISTLKHSQDPARRSGSQQWFHCSSSRPPLNASGINCETSTNDPEQVCGMLLGLIGFQGSTMVLRTWLKKTSCEQQFYYHRGRGTTTSAALVTSNPAWLSIAPPRSRRMPKAPSPKWTIRQPGLYYTILYCTVLYCSALYNNAL